jgi:hypothetical protein
MAFVAVFHFFVGLEPGIAQRFDPLGQDVFQNMSGSDWAFPPSAAFSLGTSRYKRPKNIEFVGL